MSASEPALSAGAPPPSAVTIANVVYALHGFAILVAVAGTATVIGSFLGSAPSIVAVILTYLKQSDSRGTWLESHYRWQIRTFWYALLWVAVAIVLFFTILGIPLSIAVVIALTLWLGYRVARGWLRLVDRKPMYV